MQFLTTASLLLAATAMAAPVAQTADCPNPAHCSSPPDPSTYENINVKDFYLRKNNGIQAAGFKLSGNAASDITCSIGQVPSLPSNVVKCGDSDYRFGLVESTDGSGDAGVAVYHQTSANAGMWGTGNVPTYCHAAGNGPNDFICQQVGQVTIVIT